MSTHLRTAPYPDYMVRKFLATPVYWADRIREAARQRGFDFASVKPIAEVCEALRAALDGAARS